MADIDCRTCDDQNMLTKLLGLSVRTYALPPFIVNNMALSCARLLPQHRVPLAGSALLHTADLTLVGQLQRQECRDQICSYIFTHLLALIPILRQPSQCTILLVPTAIPCRFAMH